jgi:translation initiation factor 1
MSKKFKPTNNGLVFSTDPNFKLEDDEPVQETLPPNQQKLRVRLETKHRGGKAATLIVDFIGTNDDLEDLGKKLKTFCGTGGSVKDGEIIIQGDQRDKILQWLLKNGYTNSKKAGG